MTLAEECRAAESRHEGWHVWTSDRGKPWAVRVPDGTGQETTVTAGHITQIDGAIALFEHQERCSNGRCAA